MMYYHSGNYQINNAGSLKLIFKQIYYFQKEGKKTPKSSSEVIPKYLELNFLTDASHMVGRSRKHH